MLHCSVRTTSGRRMPPSGIYSGLTLFAENTDLIVGRTLVDPSRWKVPVFSEVGMIAQVSAIQYITEPRDQPQETLNSLPTHLHDLVSQTSQDLDTNQQHRLVNILPQYADLFLAPGSTLTGHTDAVEHEIDTGHSAPIRCAPRQMSPQKMKKRGVCRRHVDRRPD